MAFVFIWGITENPFERKRAKRAEYFVKPPHLAWSPRQRGGEVFCRRQIHDRGADRQTGKLSEPILTFGAAAVFSLLKAFFRGALYILTDLWYNISHDKNNFMQRRIII